MRKPAFVFAVIGLNIPILAAALTVQEVVQHTLDTHPDVSIAINSRLATDQILAQAKAGYLPNLGLTFGYGIEHTENATTHNQHDGGGVTLTREEMGLTLSQTLFDGFQTKNKISRQIYLVKSSAYRIKDTAENLAFFITEAYLEVLHHQDLVELSKHNVVVHQKLQGQISILVKGGAGRQVDIQQSDSRLALAKAYLINAQGQLRDAETVYLRLTGQSPIALSKPQRDEFTPTLPFSLEQAFHQALSNHPSLHIAHAELAAAQAAYQQTQGYFLPEVNLELGLSNNKNLDGVEDIHNDLSAMIKMRYSLYQGGADTAKRQESINRVVIAKDTIRQVERLIEEEVRLSWNSLLTLQTHLDYLKQHVETSQQVISSYREQLKLGQRSLLDVLDSENELFNAKTALIQAQYLELLSLFKLLSSGGQLLSTLKVTLPNEAQVTEK